MFCRIEQGKIIIASVSVVVLLLMAAMLCAMIYYHHRAGLLAKMNLPNEIFEMNTKAKPDMSQLCLITFDSELKCCELATWARQLPYHHTKWRTVARWSSSFKGSDGDKR